MRGKQKVTGVPSVTLDVLRREESEPVNGGRADVQPVGQGEQDAEHQDHEDPEVVATEPRENSGLVRSEGQHEQGYGCHGDHEADNPGDLVGVGDERLGLGHDFAGSLALTAFSAGILAGCGALGGAGWLNFGVFIGGYLLAVGVTIVAARVSGQGDIGDAGIAFMEVRLTLLLLGFGGLVFGPPVVLEVGAAAISFGGLVGGISDGPVLVVVSRERRCSLLRAFWIVIRQQAPEVKP